MFNNNNMKTIYLILILGIIVAGYFLVRALMRITKWIINYKKLGHKEFMERLKKGAENITPTQKTKAELSGTIITLIGVTIGLIATTIVRIDGVWYWVCLILLGSWIITFFSLLGKWQLYRIQKKQDEIMKELNNQGGSTSNDEQSLLKPQTP